MMSRMLKFWASPKLTVWLLAALMFLIFAGTWAQIDMGIWATLKMYFRSAIVLIPLQIFLPRAWNVPGAIPFPGGALLGTLLFVNLLAAHITRFKFTKKRFGLLLIHFALMLLFVGEFVTAQFAKESNMSIDEGQTISYTEDTRTVELVIIDPSDPDVDHVVAVPESRLVHGGLISDPMLPFEIQVEDYYLNADLVNVKDVTTPIPGPQVDRGTAAMFGLAAVKKPVSNGVSGNSMDLPVVYATLFHQGQRLGTWMVSLYFSLIPEAQVQSVQVGDKTYQIALRYERTYKPYSLHLIDFAHDRYLGTDTPKNYSSRVRLVDPSQHEDREVLIYMNNPLRYRGETFYQASFKKGDGGTVLQVVRNPGWLIPYIACTIGAIGLVIQFGASLMRFLSRRRAS
jgi:ResB-like family